MRLYPAASSVSIFCKSCAEQNLNAASRRTDIAVRAPRNPDVTAFAIEHSRLLFAAFAENRNRARRRIQTHQMKIKPGWDVDVIRQVRQKFPDTLLMADANSAYTLDDAPRLKQLDEFGLIMIEQRSHTTRSSTTRNCRAQLKTPICLDEASAPPHQSRAGLWPWTLAESSISSWAA